MAGKEHSMVFRLNAQTNSGFSAAFSKAQAEFARLGSEIQNLNRLQSDISAYTKQQQEIQKTEERLKSLKKQQELLKQQIQDTKKAGESTAGLEREEKQLEDRIRSQESTLERQNQKLSETSAKLKEAGVDTANLSQEDARLTAQIQELTAQQEEAANGALSFGERASQAVDAAAQAFAAARIAELCREIYDGFMDCVTAASDFEATMSAVEAISGANAAEMERLNAKAKELGATTQYTAAQAAEAMTYMAMAGWDVNDMLSGMDSVLALAAASGEDLATVSDIVTDDLTAFGLTAADTAHFADVLAAAATNSNTNVSIMGETFKTAAPLAGVLGYSVEDVAVAVGLMANVGIKGSNAGTSLKNMFSNLIDTATLTASAFGEVEYSAVNADGTMKSFGQTITELRGYFDQMTGAEKLQNAEALVGQRAMAGFVDIMNADEASFTALTASINDCAGAAQQMADIRMDNLNGQLPLMQSAWEGLRITIGEQFTPKLSALYSIGTDVLNGANQFVQKAPQLVKAGMSVVTVLGGTAAAISAVNAALKLFKALDMAAAFTSPAGAVAMITAGVVALGVAAYELSSGADEATEALNNLLDAHEDAESGYQSSLSSIESEAASVQHLIAQLQELSVKSEKTAADQAQIVSICAQLNESVPELALSYDEESDSLQGVTDNLEEYIAALYRTQQQELDNARMTELHGHIQETAEALEEATLQMEEYQRVYDGLVSSGGELSGADNNLSTYRILVEQLTRQLEEEQAEYETLTAAYNEAAGAQEEHAAATEKTSGVIDAYNDAIRNLAGTYSEVYNAAYASFSGQFDLWDQAAEVSATSMETLQANLQSQIDYWNNYNSNLDAVMQAADAAGIDISGIWDQLSSGSPEAVAAVAGIAEAVANSADGGTEALQNYVDSYGELEEAMGQTAQTVAEGNEEVRAAVEELAETLPSILTEVDWMGTGEATAADLIAGFVNGLGDGGEASKVLTGHAESWIDALNAGLGVASPSTITRASGEDTVAGFVNGVNGMAGTGETAMRSAAQRAINAFNAVMNSSVLYAAGRNAIQGAINGINSMIPALVAAARSAGQQASNAYKAAQDINSPSRVFEYFGEMDIAGAIQGIENMQTEANRAFAASASSSAEAYQQAIAAYGMGSAEAVYADLPGMLAQAEAMQRPESTLPAAVSATDGIGGIVVQFSPVYNLSSVSNAGELRETLDAHDQKLYRDLRELILDVIAEREIEIARSHY